jgi:hypothetical protein
MGTTTETPLARVAERRRAVALARHFREAEGHSIAQIAERLGRAPATVKGSGGHPERQTAPGHSGGNEGDAGESVARADALSGGDRGLRRSTVASAWRDRGAGLPYSLPRPVAVWRCRGHSGDWACETRTEQIGSATGFRGLRLADSADYTLRERRRSTGSCRGWIIGIR